MTILTLLSIHKGKKSVSSLVFYTETAIDDIAVHVGRERREEAVAAGLRGPKSCGGSSVWT